MNTLPEIIDNNKNEATKYINQLSAQLTREYNRFFIRNSLIDEIKSEIDKFTELIRVSDRIGIVFSNAQYAISETNKLGNLISNSLSYNNSLGLSIDNRFTILYQLLDKKILKREEFMLCISQYNDIVLSFTTFKRQEYYRNLNLLTIDLSKAIQKKRLDDPRSNNTRMLQNLSYFGKIKILNETGIYLYCIISFVMKNEKRVYEEFIYINPGESKEITCKRNYYDFFASENKTSNSSIKNFLKTIKANYNYKIVLNSKRNQLHLISLD